MEGLSHWRGDIYWICKWNSQIPKVIKPKQWCIWTSACIGLPAPAFYGTAFIMPIPCFKTYGSFTFAITPKLIHLAFKILTRTLILPFLRSRPSRQVRLVSVSCTISCCNIITWYNNETWCFCLLLSPACSHSLQVRCQLIPKLILSVSQVHGLLSTSSLPLL